jgi:hypothetical protein
VHLVAIKAGRISKICAFDTKWYSNTVISWILRLPVTLYYPVIMTVTRLEFACTVHLPGRLTGGP